MKIDRNSSYIFKKSDNQTIAKTDQTDRPVSTNERTFTIDYQNYLRAMNEGYIEQDGVRLTISDEAKKKLEEMYDRWRKQQEQVNALWAAEHNAQAAKKTSEAEEDHMQDLAKVLEIARRISRGGHVPASDEKKLMEYSSEMYQMAKQAAMLAKQHKKYKEALFEEKEAEQEQPKEEHGPNHVAFGIELPENLLELGGEQEGVIAEESGLV